MQTGQSILKPNNAEVTNISPFGIWVLVNGEEYFIDYKEYPFFSEAPIKVIAALKSDSEGNLHWPDLDVDIEAEALKNPEKYTLLYH